MPTHHIQVRGEGKDSGTKCPWMWTPTLHVISSKLQNSSAEMSIIELLAPKGCVKIKYNDPHWVFIRDTIVID